MATSFGRAAGDYDRGRPDYPVGAVGWLLDGAGPVVVDVGAGTGKLTAVIVRAVTAPATVTAVDPDVQMLATLTRNLPGVMVAEGAGERIPMDDASVDAVTFGQAWHWVDVEAAAREVARVLRPGGRLGLIWNIRDEQVPWVARLGEVMHGSAAEQLIAQGGPAVGAPFGVLESRIWTWNRALGVDELVAMAASRSYVITASQRRRDRVLQDVRAIGEERARDGVLSLPYVTHAFRAERA